MIPLALWLWMAIHMRASALDAAMDDQRRAVDAIPASIVETVGYSGAASRCRDRTAGIRDRPALRSDAQFQDLLRLFTAAAPDMRFSGSSTGMARLMASDPQYVDERDRNFREFFVERGTRRGTITWTAPSSA